MSKPIKLTESMIKTIQEEFVASVKKIKLFNGNLNYSKNFVWDGGTQATVVFTAPAFAKMTMLLQTFDSEVAWHGVAFRDEKEETRFYIKDILVYPQLVTGGTVNTDQEAYTAWLYNQEDEVFNNIRMQGHSHVDFSPSPSGVDLAHQEKILEQLDDDMFYIFMIWNKRFEHTVKVYDLQNNTLYEDDDVIVRVGEETLDLDAFLKNASQQVKKKVYQPAGITSGASKPYSQPSKPSPAKTGGQDNKKEKGTPKKEAPIGSRSGYSYYNNYYYDDYGYDRDRFYT